MGESTREYMKKIMPYSTCAHWMQKVGPVKVTAFAAQKTNGQRMEVAILLFLLM